MPNDQGVTSQRPHAAVLARRLAEPRRVIQVVAGSRQVGKTTLVHQVVQAAGLPVVFASAGEPTLRGPVWIAQQWDAAREMPAGMAAFAEAFRPDRTLLVGGDGNPHAVGSRSARLRMQRAVVYASAVAFGCSASWNSARYGP